MEIDFYNNYSAFIVKIADTDSSKQIKFIVLTSHS